MSDNYSYYNDNGNAEYQSQFQQNNEDYYDYPNNSNNRGNSRGGYRHRSSDASASNGQRGSSYGRGSDYRSNGGDYRNNGGEHRSNNGGGYRSNRRFDRDDGPKFTIVESFGSFHTEPRSGYTKEVNLVSWNDAKPKFDIRPWSPHHDKMGKGLTFTQEEFVRLHIIMSTMFLANEELKTMYHEIVKQEMQDLEEAKALEGQLSPKTAAAAAAAAAASAAAQPAGSDATSVASTAENASAAYASARNTYLHPNDFDSAADQGSADSADSFVGSYSQACESSAQSYAAEQGSSMDASDDANTASDSNKQWSDPYIDGTTQDQLFKSAQDDMAYQDYDDIDEDEESEEEEEEMPF